MIPPTFVNLELGHRGSRGAPDVFIRVLQALAGYQGGLGFGGI